MIKNNKGDYEIEGSALDIICEYEELTMQIKELFKDDKDLMEIFERDLLAVSDCLIDDRDIVHDGVVRRFEAVDNRTVGIQQFRLFLTA